MIARLTLLLTLVLSAPAHALAVMHVDATGHRGFLSYYPVVSQSLTDVTISERVDGTLREIARPAMTPFPGSEFSYAILPDAGAWKCSRRTRTIVVMGRAPDGTVERGEQSVRTPSCANRMTLTLRPERAVVRDSFGRGDASARLCTPGGCTTVRLPSGRPVAARSLHIRRGDRVVLRTPYQRVAQRVGEGVTGGATVLTTGDSLMQSLDVILQDALAGEADVVSDVRVGAALTNINVVDFFAIARRQVARLHPRATVVFLGANDTYDVDTPDGTHVACCEADWGAEFERRARRVMETYAQGGAGSVAWLTIPAARDTRRLPASSQVNAALVRAARTVPGAAIVGADEIFTPGGTYRKTMPYRGRRVRVREPDGIHLTIAGARIAARFVTAALRHLGVIDE